MSGNSIPKKTEEGKDFSVGKILKEQTIENMSIVHSPYTKYTMVLRPG